MTPPDAGRVAEHYEIQFDFERICMKCREEWPCVVTTQAETIRRLEQVMAPLICPHDGHTLGCTCECPICQARHQLLTTLTEGTL